MGFETISSSSSVVDVPPMPAICCVATGRATGESEERDNGGAWGAVKAAAAADPPGLLLSLELSLSSVVGVRIDDGSSDSLMRLTRLGTILSGSFLRRCSSLCASVDDSLTRALLYLLSSS